MKKEGDKEKASEKSTESLTKRQEKQLKGPQEDRGRTNQPQKTASLCVPGHKPPSEKEEHQSLPSVLSLVPNPPNTPMSLHPPWEWSGGATGKSWWLAAKLGPSDMPGTTSEKNTKPESDRGWGGKRPSPKSQLGTEQRVQVFSWTPSTHRSDSQGRAGPKHHWVWSNPQKRKRRRKQPCTWGSGVPPLWSSGVEGPSLTGTEGEEGQEEGSGGISPSLAPLREEWTTGVLLSSHLGAQEQRWILGGPFLEPRMVLF